MTFTFAKTQNGSNASRRSELIEQLDIDKYEPDYPVPPKKCRKKDRPKYWVHFNRFTYGRASSIGVKPEKLRDWRALEKRRSQLLDLWEEANDEFWDAMYNTVQDDDDNTDRLICTGKLHMIRFHPRSRWAGETSYSLVAAERVISDSIRDKREKYVLVTEESGGRRIGELYERQNSLHKAYLKYNIAFRRAVGDRLEVYVRSKNNYLLSRTETFIVQSDTRTYVITQTQSGVVWNEGNIRVIA